VVEKTAPASVSSAVYNALTRSKLLRDLERAFRDATGLSLKLVRSGEPPVRLALGRHEILFAHSWLQARPFARLAMKSSTSCSVDWAINWRHRRFAVSQG
jgi:hypothetical protein